MNILVRQLIILLVGLTLATPSALGASQLGYGGATCSLYTRMQVEGQALSSVMDSWTLGYLSGLNQAAVQGGGEDLVAKQQPDRVISFVQGYCESNAKKRLRDAVNSYWYEVINL